MPLGALRAQAEQQPAPLPLGPALRLCPGQPIRVIAEFKRRSPSAGWIRPGADAVAVTAGYAQAGAAALSILTEPDFFGGALDDLAAVARAVPRPALRKDFLLDEYDLFAARAAGAAAVLLIVRALPDPGLLRALIDQCRDLSLTPLCEAHTRAEALAARAAGAEVIGINHRDLQTLRIDLDLSADLRQDLGPEPILVAESGLRSAADLRTMQRRGMDAVLIGEALMRAPDPGAALAALLAQLDDVVAQPDEAAAP